MTNIRYRASPESAWVELETDRDPWEVMDWVRGRWHPDIVPDPWEPAYRRAVEVGKKGQK